MKSLILLLLSAIALPAAGDDPWQPVRELRSGAELRVYKVGAKDPFSAKLDRTTDSSVIVITKTGQLSIPREEIERLDCRRSDRGPVVKETRTERKVNPKGAEVTANTTPGATTSVKTTLDLPGKSAFYTVYDRKTAAK
jgi:hypothetical protein